MGWKTIDAGRHYDKSERVGGRVKTTDFGAGESGSRIAQMIAFERSESAADMQQPRGGTGGGRREATSHRGSAAAVAVARPKPPAPGTENNGLPIAP
jgi:hypothetical protein